MQIKVHKQFTKCFSHFNSQMQGLILKTILGIKNETGFHFSSGLPGKEISFMNGLSANIFYLCVYKTYGYEKADIVSFPAAGNGCSVRTIGTAVGQHTALSQ